MSVDDCKLPENYGPWSLFLPGHNPDALPLDWAQKFIRENFIKLSDALAAIDQAIVLKGEWDASVGTFPAGDEAGWSYIVSVAGVVDGVDFRAGDRVIALVDGASSTVYAGNWHHADYTDLVTSVFGRTGAVTAQAGDYTAAQITDAVTKAPTADQVIANNGYNLSINGTGDFENVMMIINTDDGVSMGNTFLFDSFGMSVNDNYIPDHIISINIPNHWISIFDQANNDQLLLEKDQVQLFRLGTRRIWLKDHGQIVLDVNGNRKGIEVKQHSGGSEPAFRVSTNNTGDQKAFQLARNGQTSAHTAFTGNVDGAGNPGIELGDGVTSNRDTQLWRAGADHWKTPDKFEGDSIYSTSGILGMTPLAADPVSPIDNTAWILDSGGQTFLKFRVGGVTKSVELT